MKLNLNVRRILVAVIALLVILEVSFMTFLNINEITTNECWMSLEEASKNIDVQLTSIFYGDIGNLEFLSKVISEKEWICNDENVEYIQNMRIGLYNFPVRYYSIDEDYLIYENGFIDNFSMSEFNDDVSENSVEIESILDAISIDEPVLSLAHKDPFSNSNIMELMVPVEVNDKKIGILTEVVKLDRLPENINRTSADFKYDVLVLDRRNHQMVMDTFHNTSKLFLEQCFSNNAIEPFSFDTWNANVLNGIGDKVAYLNPADDKVYYVFAIDSKVSDYMVIVLANEDEVFQNSNRIRSSFILLFFVEVFIIVCSTVWLLWATKTRINQNTKEMQELLNEANSDKITYKIVMKALSNTYEIIYYVDCNSNHFEVLMAKDKNGELQITNNGDEFFDYIKERIGKIVFTPDKKMVLEFMNKKKILKNLRENNDLSLMFRCLIDKQPLYYMARFKLINEFGAKNMIISISNIHSQHLQTLEFQAKLAEIKAMNNKDSLTGVNNMKAFALAKERINQNNNNEKYSIVVCNVNNIKEINDTMGLTVGDEYICDASKLICDVFSHSPVYRIGGDEFAVLLFGKDFEQRESIIENFKQKILKNLEMGDFVVAVGWADHETDKSFDEVYNQADSDMYKDKEKLKKINF